MKRLRHLLLCLLPTMLASTAAAETMDDVIKAISDKAAACKSISCKTKSDQDMQTPDMKYVAQSEMTFEAVRKDGKWQYRSEGWSKSTTNAGGQETKQDMKLLMVQDGQFSWMLNDTNGQKSCMKMAPSHEFGVLTDAKTWEEMKKLFDYKLAGDEALDGKACWLVEATTKDKTTAASAAKTLTWYDKSTGVGMKSITKDDKGKVVSTSITSDVKIDPSIAADRFVFKAPEGVTVTDMTQQGQQPAEQPAAEPKKEEPKKKDDKGKIKLPKLP
ncbi:MAG: LolA family protein [Phycisphaerae bacterium]